MRNILLISTAVILLSSRLAAQSTLPGTAQDRTLLPNGWYLTPAGQSIPLSSDLPLNMALAPDGVHLAITNNGNGRQKIDLVNLQKQLMVDSVTIGKAWLGLTFARKHPYLYASGGNDDIIIRYRLTGDRLRTTVWDSTLP